MNRTRIVLTACLLALAPAASAQSIIGRVVDADGLPVANCNLDVENNVGGGGDPDIGVDFTDAQGFFNCTVTPAGIYDIVFNPPRPPQTTHLKVVLTNRAVTGVTDLGTIVLPRGVALSGRVLDEIGAPVGGVDLDVNDLTTGLNVQLQGDNTDTFGNFLIAVPPGPIRFLVDTTTIPLRTFAPLVLQISPSANTDLGNLNLQPGFVVTGSTNFGGLPLAGVDLDAEDSLTGEPLFLQGDNTGATGSFSVVVPAGTYDFAVCPPLGLDAIAKEYRSVVVSANLNVGPIFLEPGVRLSGTVLTCNGTPAVGVDLEVNRTSGEHVFVCHDNTDASGNYSVVVPTGTFDVLFREPTLGTELVENVSVPGNTLLNATISPTSVTVRNGDGVNPLAFTSLTPPTLGTTWSATVDCSGHTAGFVSLVSRQFRFTFAPAAQGQRLIAGPILVQASMPHSGGLVQFDLPIPNDPVLCGLLCPTQATITGGFIQRTNALDLVLGH